MAEKSDQYRDNQTQVRGPQDNQGSSTKKQQGQNQQNNNNTRSAQH